MKLLTVPKLDPPEYKMRDVFSKLSLAKERNVPLSADQSLSTADQPLFISIPYLSPTISLIPLVQNLSSKQIALTAYYQSQMMLASINSGNKHVTHLYFTGISVAFQWVMGRANATRLA